MLRLRIERRLVLLSGRAQRMRSLVLVLCVATPLVAIAQDEKKCPQREAYNSLRYDEDWSALGDPDCRIEAIDDLKFIALWGDAYMSLGGEARLRYERYTNSGFGSDPPTDSGYVLQRYLVHTDIHFTRSFRFFVQFQSGIENGRNGGPRPTEEDTAEFHQGFVDIPLAHFCDSALIFRIGRQELEFGSGRMVGASEALNIRRSFDGLRFQYAHGKWSFIVIASCLLVWILLPS